MDIYQKERENAYKILKSVKGSEIILQECYPEIMEWASKYLKEIIKLFPIKNWELDWCYSLIQYFTAPKKYSKQLYQKISESNWYSYYTLKSIKVPEKYQKLLKKSASKGGY